MAKILHLFNLLGERLKPIMFFLLFRYDPQRNDWYLLPEKAEFISFGH